MIDRQTGLQSNGQMPNWQDNELTFRDYLFILRLHLKKILLFGLLGLGYSIYHVMTIPPSYTAIATVVIQDKPGAGMIMDITGNRDRNRMTNEMQLIRSRSVAKATIKEIWRYKKNNLALFGSYPFYPRGKRLRQFTKEILTLGLYDPSTDLPLRYNEEYS